MRDYSVGASAEQVYIWITFMTMQFRMVAERICRLQKNVTAELGHRLRAAPLHTVQHIAERELLPCHYQ
eukprot:6394467-Amphidinium_carterae.1